MNEPELTALLKQGNRQAFDYLVENYQVRVFNSCLGILHNTEDAEDIAQEVFVEVFRSVNGFKIQTINMDIPDSGNQVAGSFTQQKTEKHFGFVKALFSDETGEPRFDPPDFVHPGVELENKELAAYLFKAIGELPENQKTAFTLHKVEGMSYQEISEVMETTVSSVESLMFRAKQNLKNILSDYYNDKI